MTSGRFDPRAIEPSDTDGDIFTTVNGKAAWAAAAAAPTPLVTVDENGHPGLVFDDDGEIVYVEVP